MKQGRLTVECLDSLELRVVLLVHEVLVGTFSVPRVERVISDHSKSFLGNCDAVVSG